MRGPSPAGTPSPLAAAARPLEILYVVNNRLPPSDYRLVFGARSNQARITFALPERPESLPPDRFLDLAFHEGLEAGDARRFVRLFLTLRRGRHHYDLVHLYCTKLTLFGPMIARLAGVRSLVTVTGFGRAFAATGVKGRLLRLAYLSLFWLATRASDLTLFQNHTDLADTKRRFPRLADRFRYIGTASDFSIPDDASASAASEDTSDDSAARTRVLLVTRVMPMKGIEDFIEVADRLADQPVDFVLVGPQSRGADELAGRLADAERRGVLRYLGPQYGEDLIRHYREADIFYFPSAYPEGIARVLLEAGQAGLVAVAYDIAANRDVVKPAWGRLVDIGDTRAAADAILALARDPAQRRQQAAAYREAMDRDFSMDAYVERLDHLLAERYRSGRTAPEGTDPEGTGPGGTDPAVNAAP